MLWIEWLTAVALCSVVTTITYFALKDNDDVPNNLHSLRDMAVFLTRRFQAAIALMIGFYMIQSLSRWSDVRNVERNVMGTVNALALRISWRFRDPVGQDEDKKEDEEEKKEGEKNQTAGNTDKTETQPVSEEQAPSHNPRHSLGIVRFQLIRWLNLSHAIVVGELYETKNNAFSTLERIKESGLATRAECNFLNTKPHYKFAAPLVWFMDLIDELQKKKLLNVDNGIINVLADDIIRVRCSLEDLYMFRNTPIPLCYRQLVNATVRVYMIILLLAGILSAKLEEREDSLGSLTRGTFWYILLFALEYFLFVGWLTVADALGNPFRSWSDGLEWEIYVKALYESSLLLSSGVHDESLHMPEEKDFGTGRWNICLLDPPPAPERRKGLAGKRRILTGF